MGAKAAREGFALFEVLRHVGQDAYERLFLDLIDERGDRLDQRDTRTNQGRELPRQDRDIARRGPI